MKKNKNGAIKILIAEDSQTQAELLKNLLEENNYVVYTAVNGMDALAQLENVQPALVISDVVMPEMDGYSLCKAIKSDEKLKHIPVMLVTTLSDPGDVISGLECGADNFIRKPYEEKYLLSRIDYLLMNVELRKNQRMQMALEIDIGGKKHFISAERQQILDLLVSTYEQAVSVNSELKERERELEHSNQVLHGLNRIAEGLNSAVSEREVAEIALLHAMDLPGIQAGWICMREGEGDFRLVAMHNLPPAFSAPGALDGDCACRRQLLSGQPGAVSNIMECERLAKAAGDTNGLRYHASVPLCLGERTVGLMNLVGPKQGLFDEDELRVLHSVGQQLAVAMERASLHEHLEQLVEERTSALRVSEARLRAIIEAEPECVKISDAEGRLVHMNAAGLAMVEAASLEEVRGGMIADFVVPAQRAAYRAFEASVLGGSNARFEFEITDLKGARHWMDSHAVPLPEPQGGRPQMLAISRDITQRKANEARIARLNRIYSVLSGINTTIVHVRGEDELFAKACRIAVEHGQFIFAWIGKFDAGSRQVTPLAQAGSDDGYLAQVKLLAGEGIQGCCMLTAQALDEMKPVVCNDIASDGRMAALRSAALSRNYRSVAVFPLLLGGRPFGVFALYSAETDAFDEEEMKLLVEMSGDISYALDNLRLEAQRKQAESELRKLSQAVEQSANSIVITDLNANIEYVNDGFLKATGYSRDEVIGHNPSILHSGKNSRETYQDMWTHLTRGEEWKGEFINRRKNGSEFTESIFVSPVRDAEGRITHYLGIKEDITERKRMERELLESEARYRRITEGITDYQYAVRIENGRSVETTQSPACVIATGYTADEFTANPHLWMQMVVPEDRELVMQHVNRILAGKDVLPIEHRIIRKDGEIRWISDTTILFRNAAGELLAYDGVIKDITERKQAEAMLQQLNEELENKVAARTKDLEQSRLEAEQANQAKSAFLATMSHEIRTPMNGVIGMLDVLKQSSLKGSQMEMVNIIHDSAFALLAIIDDILDFSKIEAGKLQIESAPMSIVDAVEGVCKTLDRMALKNKVELTLFTAPDLPALAFGDAGRLRQILINLVNNAIKFSSGQELPGKVSVRALALARKPQQLMMEFRVTDNGIGIDMETQERLFTPFTQANFSTTRSYGGTGLGLAITRQLVNRMGGEIMVQSAMGKGSLFCVRIPFAMPPEQPVAGKAAFQLAGLSCLVVDDLDGIADDLAAYLAHENAMVERVADIDAARQWIAARPAGLCIVIIDAANARARLDELRAAAAQAKLDSRFVAIGRGGRRKCRTEAPGWVALDIDVMGRRAFLEAVAIAAGLAEQPAWEVQPEDNKVAAKPLSRENARRRGSLILVAEDNEINQKVILQQLKLLGRTADLASNGREALERWQSGDYCMLITDLHMPEMDGYELATAIRAAERGADETQSSETQAAKSGKARAPIIAISANATKGEADHCIAVGMDDYLSKPVQLAKLKAMLEKWMPAAGQDPVPVAAVLPVAAALEGSPNVVTPVAIDVNVLKVLVGDDEAMIGDFLHDFHLSAAKIAAELRAACAAGQAAAAGALAHKLKSSARSVGALALGELCAGMEQAGKAGDMEALAMLLRGFEHELASVERYLDEY